MSGRVATASPRCIKAAHRRRRKIASGQSVQRYYDPQIGRFLSVDPVTANSGTGANFNRYWYANNNPYRFTDPDGRRSKEEADHKREIAQEKRSQQEHREKVASQEALQPVIPEAVLLPAIALVKTLATVAEVAAPISKAPEITKPYARPSGTPTAAQRASVQGKPCVDCGAVTSRQVADHKTPLVKEYYQTGRIDMEKAKSLDSVQPQCPTCSARQGAEMSRYSRAMKEENGL